MCILKLIRLFFIEYLFIIFCVCLVSSQATSETFFRVFKALGEISYKFPIGVPTIYKIPLSGSWFYVIIENYSFYVIKLPFGLDINNLIDDLRIFSWEAADILIYYSNLIKIQKKK